MPNTTKKTKRKSSGLGDIEALWPRVSEYLFVPANEKEYDRLVEFMNYLIDRVDSETHPLAGLLDVVGTLVSEYEQTHHPIKPLSPCETLRLLMKEHSLTQSDLAAELGGQGTVSKILNGQRELNKRQIEALSKRFNVSPGIFFAK